MINQLYFLNNLKIKFKFISLLIIMNNTSDLILTFIIILLIIYNVIILPKLNEKDLELFKNIYIRGIIIICIVVGGYYNSLLSLIFSISFVLTHDRLNKVIHK